MAFHHFKLPDYSTLLSGRNPREFCCFPAGVYHAVVEVHPPIETLMIRAPSVEDKVFKAFE